MISTVAHKTIVDTQLLLAGALPNAGITAAQPPKKIKKWKKFVFAVDSFNSLLVIFKHQFIFKH